MANTIKLTQEDLKKMVQNIVKEQSELDEQSTNDVLKPGPGKMELNLGLTDDGGYVLYRTNENGEDEVVQKFDK
jgi:hypothetical protein